MRTLSTSGCSKLGSWLKLANQLKQDEEKLKSTMSDSRRRILDPKRLLLMKHIITSEGYDDVGLADDLISGFSLVGEVPRITCASSEDDSLNT